MLPHPVRPHPSPSWITSPATWSGSPHAASAPACERGRRADPQRQARAGGNPAIPVEAPLLSVSPPCACLVSRPQESETSASRALHRPAGDPQQHDGERTPSDLAASVHHRHAAPPESERGEAPAASCRHSLALRFSRDRVPDEHRRPGLAHRQTSRATDRRCQRHGRAVPHSDRRFVRVAERL
jgi:hypothetical protein